MDDPRIDAYLTTVERQLVGLSPGSLAAEIRELRDHLEQMVAWRIAGGLDIDAAVSDALAQFGDAAEIGIGLRDAATQPHGRPKTWAVRAYFGVVAVVFTAFATANDRPSDFPHEWQAQLALALVLPFGFLVAALRSRQRITANPH